MTIILILKILGFIAVVLAAQYGRERLMRKIIEIVDQRGKQKEKP